MYNRQKVVLTRWREVLWKSEWMTIIWPFERPRLCLCWLGNDDPFLDTGAVPTLPEGRPQVCPDLIVFGVRAVESDVEVGSEMSVLVLDVVGGGLHKRKLAVLSQHQVPFEMINASFARDVLLLELSKISFSQATFNQQGDVLISIYSNSWKNKAKRSAKF